ncbi:ATP synthase subunit O, mitochondrial-like, partial [Centruroides sculpturatus]|uniref:ATP synthase subunit O, mitochondrial-like n=1 Tax=Centruroides sculpturatus TaxID=218467 RepID=UPI000C6DC4E8
LRLQARHFSTSVRNQASLIQPPIAVFGIEGRYATALYSAACKEKKLEATETELKRLNQLLTKDVKLAEFISNPLIKKFIKRDQLTDALKKQNFSNLTINFISVLAENARLRNLKGVLDTFANIMSAYRGELLCEVITAKRLEDAQLKELETALQGFLKKGEKIILNTKVFIFVLI